MELRELRNSVGKGYRMEWEVVQECSGKYSTIQRMEWESATKKNGVG